MAIQTSSRKNSINMSRCHVFPWMTAGSLHSQSFFKLTGSTDSSWIRCRSSLPTRNQNCSAAQFTKDKHRSKRYDRVAKPGALRVSQPNVYTLQFKPFWLTDFVYTVVTFILIATDQFNILLLSPGKVFKKPTNFVYSVVWCFLLKLLDLSFTTTVKIKTGVYIFFFNVPLLWQNIFQQFYAFTICIFPFFFFLLYTEQFSSYLI